MTLEAVDCAVPAYFHPAVAGELWERLAGAAHSVRFVVVNVHDGPGADLDPSYPPVVSLLRGAGIRLVGYVDTGYGARAVGDVVAEAATYRSRYGITGVFLDQVASGQDLLATYRDYARRLRDSGADFVVLNPGTFPDPEYLDMADVTVCFEGAWKDHESMVEPDWVRATPVSGICHLVYDAPAHAVMRPDLVARGRHVQTLCVTSGKLPNPWDRLPGVLMTK